MEYFTYKFSLKQLVEYILKIGITWILLFVFTTSCYSQTFIELNEEFIELYQKGNFKEAVIVGEKAIIQCKKEYGEKHENYAIALQNLADGYFALNNKEKALPNYKKAIIVYYKIYNTYELKEVALINNKIGVLFFNDILYDSATHYYHKSAEYFFKFSKDNYDNLFTICSNLVDCYLNTSNFIQLLQLTERILPIIEKEKGTENEAFYSMQYYKAHSLFNLNKLEKAEPLYKKSLALAEKLFGKNNSEYVTILNALYDVLKALNKIVEAEPILLESITIQESFSSIDTIKLAATYERAGTLYSDNSQFVKAEIYYNKALKLLELAGLENTENYYFTLQSLSYSYIQCGKLIEAKKILENLINIFSKKHGRENEINAQLLIVLSNAEAQLNFLSAAEEHATEGYKMTIKLLGNNHYSLANAKEVFGMVYNKIGDSKKSILAYLEGLEIIKNVFGEESRQAASLQSNLGITYFEMGNYADAEIVLTKSLQTRKKLLGNKHVEYAISLINLSMIHLFQARYNEADKLLLEALQIYIDRDLLHTTNFISLLNNIALLAEKISMTKEAKKMYLALLFIMEKNKEKNVTTLSLVYSNLSVLYFNENNYDEVIKYSLIAMDLLEKDNKKYTKEYVKSLNNLFLAYKNKGNFSKANELSSELLALCIKVMGKDAELLGIIYNNIAMLEAVQSNKDNAANYLSKGNEILLNKFRENFYTLSEKEKLTWWDNQSFIFNLFPSLLKQFNIEEGKWVELMINQQIQLKGFVLTDEKATLRKARNNKQPAVKKLLDEWYYHKDILAKMYALPILERDYKTDSIEQKINSLEKQINQLTSGKIQLKESITTWKDIQQQLQNNEAAIEFVRFPFYRNNIYSDTLQYAAIVITKNASPKFIQLGTEKQLEFFMQGNSKNSKEVNIHRLYRSRLVKKDNNQFIGDSIYKLIWQPLMPYIKNNTIISYAPDALLHKIAFHALPISNERILIDSFQLQQYSGIKQIADRKLTQTFTWKSAFLMGNIDFNKATPKNGFSITNTNRENISWAQLPGTENEVSEIKKLFVSNKIQVASITGTNATEESFKSLSFHSANIIHLATHGFFLNEIQQNTTGNISFRGEQILSTTENPLFRSGIILAGANKVWGGEKIADKLEDGIVNAYEISQLDLSNTNLVVLSACETALGEIQGTEGVFGLQRAFKMAGVKNLIVSLWQVPDKETAELMISFYSKLLKGNSVRNAFYFAQKEMREKYAPFSWAAFVLIE